MKLDGITRSCIILAWAFFSSNSMAQDVCTGYGPQTPRDIDNLAGQNKSIFSMAPSYQKMNLCNLHFHVNAEHKAKDFSIVAGEGGENGVGGGYKCNDTRSLTREELRNPEVNHCAGLKPGDTLEVHWVYSSCDVEPGHTLKSCLSPKCANPNLRAEAQVFIAVNDPSALNFRDFDYGGIVNGYHQAKSLPGGTGKPVEFLGSTTGADYDAATKCSSLQVSWSLRPHCAKVDINSLSEWCKKNVFDEKGAQGARKLVTDLRLLADMN